MSKATPMKPGRRVEIYMSQGGLKFSPAQLKRLRLKGNKALKRLAKYESEITGEQTK